MVRSSYITVAAFSAYLGISGETARSYIRRGLLKAHQLPTVHYSDERPRKTGRAEWRIHEDDLADFLRRFRGDGKIPAGLLRER